LAGEPQPIEFHSIAAAAFCGVERSVGMLQRLKAGGQSWPNLMPIAGIKDIKSSSIVCNPALQQTSLNVQGSF
ncbi:hypothetical protein, partial [Mesorhizobium sp. J18]|uniref:hypothetical protein n=1 Tax=Mesorhizobium sp. J18 TaxID=935263 RepID=UPI001AEF1D0C